MDLLVAMEKEVVVVTTPSHLLFAEDTSIFSIVNMNTYNQLCVLYTCRCSNIHVYECYISVTYFHIVMYTYTSRLTF